MVCIYCKHKTSVSNSRSSAKSNTTWRRRSCQKCKAIFTSVEAPDLSKSIRVQTQNNTLEPFLRDKLFISILQSLSHRKNALEEAGALTTTVIGALLSSYHGLIPVSELKETALLALSRFDQVAATHYQAHHPSKHS